MELTEQEKEFIRKEMENVLEYWTGMLVKGDWPEAETEIKLAESIISKL
jgi:hypothetical protein